MALSSLALVGCSLVWGPAIRRGCPAWEAAAPHPGTWKAWHPVARPARCSSCGWSARGYVDARALLAALEAAALNLGVRMVPGTVRELLVGPGAVTGVRLADDSTLSSGTVVLAAGATSGTLADGVLPPGAVPPMLHGTGVSLHVTRTVTTTPITGPELGSTHTLMREACEQIDHTLAFSRIQHLMSGTRPIPLDCFPLLGTCSLSGLVFATGTCRDGFHYSPVVARHLATTLLGSPHALDRLTAYLREARAHHGTGLHPTTAV
ncbi:FAD-dependent oxidoreductase [Streptomyces abikoensis]|uniref:FAD-dependent oxidoreductase n=2 Tax=Streptomyces abikoensis TaxID=97398 RepID=UPI001679DFE2|nr:FAD-dependent oxidoreductase [Streptomyces abikoensis]